MVEDLSDEKIVEYREVFNLFDEDKDGKINLKELGTIMRYI